MLRHNLSLCTLAKIEAAEIACTLLSPFTIASAKTSSTGSWLPSTSTLLGFNRSPLTARCIAKSVACKMFSVSISSTVASAIEQHKALARIWSNKRSRFKAVSFLESAKPGMGCKSSNMTAAATTGPAKGPRPASSTPAINPGASQTKAVCSVSNDFFDRIGRQLGSVHF